MGHPNDTRPCSYRGANIDLELFKAVLVNLFEYMSLIGSSLCLELEGPQNKFKRLPTGLYGPTTKKALGSIKDVDTRLVES
jgi:hypothetical protein